MKVFCQLLLNFNSFSILKKINYYKIFFLEKYYQFVYCLSEIVYFYFSINLFFIRFPYNLEIIRNFNYKLYMQNLIIIAKIIKYNLNYQMNKHFLFIS